MTHPRTQLTELGIHARKSMSQNFLMSPHWIELLTDRIIMDKPDQIWEIGPGLGALSFPLVKKSPVPVRLFELDKTLAPYLREKLPEAEVIQGDFLEFDLDPYFKESGKIGLISNLPYHVSSPIFFRLLENRCRFVSLVLTFQRELAQRLMALPRTPDYGALSVSCQLCFEIKSLGIIPAGAFFPKPEIDSQALYLKPMPMREPESIPITKLVRRAFAHRRKKMVNNLKDLFPSLSIKDWEQLLGNLGLSMNCRPEEVAPEIFLGLAKLLGNCPKPEVAENEPQ